MPRVLDDFRRTQLAIAALFCFLGFQYATWASRIPALKERLDLSAGEVGLLLVVTGAGAVASFPLITYLMQRLGARSVALLSGLSLVAILLVLAVAPNYPTALVIVCADGVAVGCLNVAMNAQGAALEKVHGRTAMTQLHATFSAGSFLAALLSSGVTALTPDIAFHFAVAAVILLVLLAYARPRLLAEEVSAASSGEPVAEQEEGKRRRRFTRLTLAVLWLGCAMVFAEVVEGSMNDWSALYLKDIAHASPQVAPLGIAVISSVMIVARLFGDGWRSRWGDASVVRVGSTAAGAGLGLALLTGGVVPALIGFACVGLGVAAVAPCLYVAAAAEGPQALSVVAATGTTGLLVGPALIGFVAEVSDLAWGMAVVAASAVVVSLCTTRLRFVSAKASSEVSETDMVDKGTT
ncbi:MFS transporter [Streptomyces griseorubiginosus]|uniref:MFS transporter n=1 Tax=Streptomyces griseorubiginosus TaxID=67304 RepID=UPI001AD6C3FE|nr:MFS transporter [Streptomyces griseorubiginosus]MBO4256154.1 MFS transporter [Streptomyces griseorubiginosus]